VRTHKGDVVHSRFLQSHPSCYSATENQEQCLHIELSVIKFKDSNLLQLCLPGASHRAFPGFISVWQFFILSCRCVQLNWAGIESGPFLAVSTNRNSRIESEENKILFKMNSDVWMPKH